MNIIISNSSGVPIYKQIVDQMKEMIIKGELAEGDALPSMRLLSKELRISIITTKRAYEEMEREGYIESYTGKGSFVKGINRERIKETVLYEIEALFDEILEKAELAGISMAELEQIMHTLQEEKGNE